MQRNCFLSELDATAVVAEVFFFFSGGIVSIGSGAGGRDDGINDTVDLSALTPRMSASRDEPSWKNGGCSRANSCTNTRGGETIALTRDAGRGDCAGKEKLAQLRLDKGCKRVKCGELSKEISGNDTSTCWLLRLSPIVELELLLLGNPASSLAGVGGSRGDMNSPSSSSARRMSFSSVEPRRGVSTKPFAKNILSSRYLEKWVVKTGNALR